MAGASTAAVLNVLGGVGYTRGRRDSGDSLGSDYSSMRAIRSQNRSSATTPRPQWDDEYGFSLQGEYGGNQAEGMDRMEEGGGGGKPMLMSVMKTPSLDRTGSTVKKPAMKRGWSIMRKDVQESILPTADVDTLTRLQRQIRRRVLYSHRLHRKHLADRLIFESRIVVGTLRLVIMGMIFGIFWSALIGSSSVDSQRGIYQVLDGEFGFDHLRTIRTRDEFITESLPAISASSKKFFVLADDYFRPSPTMSRGSAATEFISERTRFAVEKVGPAFTLLVPSYTWTVWVTTSGSFVEGHIIRKRPVQSGPGVDLACWGIFLHKSTGPELRYGAHDHFPLTATLGDVGEVRVGLTGGNATGFITAETPTLVTVVVTETEVSFFRNLEKMGSATLPRPVTDCENNNENVLLGSEGLDLATLRFYPEPLSEKIDQLYVSGGLLGDIAKGSTPAVPPETETTDFSRQTRFRLNALDAKLSDQETKTETAEINNVWKLLTKMTDVTTSHVVATAHRSAALSTGAIAANNTLLTDTSTGRQYYPLLQEPSRLTSTAALPESDQRHLTGMPDFHGTGMTLSFWYRHVACEGGVPTCGVYLFEMRTAHPKATGSTCWGLWLENQGLYWDNPQSSGVRQYPRNFVDAQYEFNGDVTWRHVALVFDETSDKLRLYMDGNLAHEGSWGSEVSKMACNAAGSSKVLTLGRKAGPGWRLSAEVEVHDLRMYVHSDGAGTPLSAGDVAAIAAEVTPGIDGSYKCLLENSTALRDGKWRDDYGHGCAWYAAAEREGKHVCSYAPAQLACPVACKSRQECFPGHVSPTPTFYAWDSIRRIDSLAPNGKLCLGSHLTPEIARSECEAWVTAKGGAPAAKTSPEVAQWLETMLDTTREGTPRIDYTLCAEMAAAIDDHCSFNTTAVRAFTAASNANGKAFTIAFWTRPSDVDSLHPPSQMFQPSVNFMATLSPPTHTIVVGKTLHYNGEARVFTSCDYNSGMYKYESVELEPHSSSEWTFFAVSRDVAGVTRVVTNSEANEEVTPAMPTCFFDSAAMFNAIEVNYPTVMSPVLMVPEAMPLATLQRMYYDGAAPMLARTGPLVSKREAETDETIPLDKYDYITRSTLVTTPIIFQERSKPRAGCKHSYSTKYVETIHNKVKTELCVPPYRCAADVMEKASVTMSCPGEHTTQWEEFGLEPYVFGKKEGFGELLYSVTDSVFLFRNGKVTPTFRFIDSLTSSVQVLLVFYTPKTGTTSLLSILADFDGVQEAKVFVTLDHYAIVEGTNLTLYLIMQLALCVLVLGMFSDAARYYFRKFMQGRPNPDDVEPRWLFPPYSVTLTFLADFVTTLMTVAFSVMSIPEKSNTASKTAKIAGGLTNISWSSSDGVESLKGMFFSDIGEMIELFAFEGFMHNFANWILFITMFRIVQSCNVHPRLGMITGTVYNASDDLLHFFLLVAIISSTFACIGFWRFGMVRPEFSTVGNTLGTLLDMVLGNLPLDWYVERELQVYVLIFIAICFFLVQNFLLAIIVEAYMNVRRHNETLDYETDYASDLVWSITSYIKGRMYGWPNSAKLGEEMLRWNCRYSIGYKDLEKTRLFKDEEQIGRFVAHYHRFKFLKPIHIKHHAPAKIGLEVVEEIERRTAGLLGKAGSLRKMANNAMQYRADRFRKRAEARETQLDQQRMGFLEVSDGHPLSYSAFAAQYRTENGHGGGHSNTIGSVAGSPRRLGSARAAFTSGQSPGGGGAMHMRGPNAMQWGANNTSQRQGGRDGPRDYLQNGMGMGPLPGAVPAVNENPLTHGYAARSQRQLLDTVMEPPSPQGATDMVFPRHLRN